MDLNLLYAYNFSIYADELTRNIGGLSSCLDHVFIRNSRTLDYEYALDAMDYTDHVFVLFLNQFFIYS